MTTHPLALEAEAGLSCGWPVLGSLFAGWGVFLIPAHSLGPGLRPSQTLLLQGLTHPSPRLAASRQFPTANPTSTF
jgi:hypothetical protein